MKKKRLTQKERRKIVESVVGPVPWDKFTPGIYNFCDRWCERCPDSKKDKCYLYWEEQKDGGKPKNIEEAFASTLGQLRQANELIYKISEAEDIDLTITPKDEAEFERKEKLADPRKEQVVINARKLSEAIYDWLQKSSPIGSASYIDAQEKISWHNHLIRIKTHMAMLHFKEEKIETGLLKEIAKELRSKTAWMAYRSTKICKESLEDVWRETGDTVAMKLVEECKKHIITIEKSLLS